MSNSDSSSNKKRTLIVIVVILAALAVFGLLAGASAWTLLRDRLGSLRPAPTATVLPVTATAAGPVSRYPLAQDNSIGDPNAPVKIVEYSDFQCPYCRRFAVQTFPRILETYIETGKVYFTYRSMGEFIGPESDWAMQAAYCAGEQGLFWDYTDLLWNAQTGENVGAYRKENLLRLAERLGLNMGLFEPCLTGGKYAARTLQDLQDGLRAGVQGTPSFVINGQLAIQGAYPFEKFQEVIEALLAGK